MESQIFATFDGRKILVNLVSFLKITLLNLELKMFDYGKSETFGSKHLKFEIYNWKYII